MTSVSLITPLRTTTDFIVLIVNPFKEGKKAVTVNPINTSPLLCVPGLFITNFY